MVAKVVVGTKRGRVWGRGRSSNRDGRDGDLIVLLNFSLEIIVSHCK